MKRIKVLIALALCLSLLVTAGAEGSLKRGWEVVERKTPLFERLPEVHYGPKAVVEYDAEHFAVFADPETGYWGVGLKAEYYPVNPGDTFSFERPAVIVLGGIGFDNNHFASYDIRISIDRITYASLNGTTVNQDADVLGVFGYSRGMETIGFLSGWGCRAQRDESGAIAQYGDVWLVEDAAAYDTFGLCTEAEISVTALNGDGSELDPKNVGWTRWIVADLDMLQPDGNAEGYDPHYFNEQLILQDGFVYSYFVQQGNVANIEGKTRENDSDMGSGVMTGLSEGELAKRYSSILLQQDKLTAHVIWRGCGSMEAPARTELVFMGAEKKPVVEKTGYTVRYLEEGTNDKLAEPKTVDNQAVGKNITENAIAVENYDLVSVASQSITLVRDAAQNVITFYYKVIPQKYSVTYVVNPDPTYGTPENSPVVPVDEKEYASGETVKVAEQLTTPDDYAYNAKGEKISGTWKFTPWDKDDFQICENTTITGGWTFTPAPPPVKYKYVVHYVLFDNIKTKVADDETFEVDKLGITVTEYAKTGNALKAKYRKNYQPVPGFESVKDTIDRDGYEIYIYYQKKSSSS